MKNMGMHYILMTLTAIVMASASSGNIVAETESKTLLSEKAVKACHEAGSIYNISPEFLMSIGEAESSGNPKAENGTCKGIMQVSEKWHKERMCKLGLFDLFDERDNIMIAADYLSDLFEKYKDPALVLDIYNGNKKAQENYEKGILSEYSKKVLDRSRELEESGEIESNLEGGVG